jgi:hypothetical protein
LLSLLYYTTPSASFPPSSQASKQTDPRGNNKQPSLSSTAASFDGSEAKRSERSLLKRSTPSARNGARTTPKEAQRRRLHVYDAPTRRMRVGVAQPYSYYCCDWHGGNRKGNRAGASSQSDTRMEEWNIHVRVHIRSSGRLWSVVVSPQPRNPEPSRSTTVNPSHRKHRHIHV